VVTYNESNDQGNFMNAEKAVQAHRAWKERFLAAMIKREQMNVEEIRSDCCCDFGKWLRGDAKNKYGHLASYTQCVALHANFHLEAGKIAQEINDGEFLLASHQFINPDTPYAKASQALIDATIALGNDAKAENIADAQTA
jgi:methyl-accepting chemotaxis protein